jgi:hypothetical protein
MADADPVKLGIKLSFDALSEENFTFVCKSGEYKDLCASWANVLKDLRSNILTKGRFPTAHSQTSNSIVT